MFKSIWKWISARFEVRVDEAAGNKVAYRDKDLGWRMTKRVALIRPAIGLAAVALSVLACSWTLPRLVLMLRVAVATDGGALDDLWRRLAVFRGLGGLLASARCRTWCPQARSKEPAIDASLAESSRRLRQYCSSSSSPPLQRRDSRRIGLTVNALSTAT